MLLLSLPKSKPTGTCRINGKPAEYLVLQAHLEFRYEGEDSWDRRRILDALPDGDLIRFTCDDGPGSQEPYVVIRPQTGTQSDNFYWLAINGASVAASSLPMPLTVTVRPIPEQLIGYRTRKAQFAAQEFLLTASISEVASFMANEMPGKIESGEVVYIRPNNPEPPTTGATLWQCSSSANDDDIDACGR